MDYAAAARRAAEAPPQLLQLFVMRGPSGGGKTHQALAIGGARFSTDDYFVDADSGVYEWRAHLLGDAHRWNQERVRRAIAARQTPIVVDNTNLEAWQAHPYVVAALAAGYVVTIVDAAAPWCRDPAQLAAHNSHHVSEELCADMVRRWDQNRYTVQEAALANRS